MTPSESKRRTLGPENRGAHFKYLDGIRGLAALYVLVEHAQLCGLDFLGARNLPPGAGTSLQQFARFLNSSVLGFGHLAVDVFIVLSGYCLMLPVAQSPDSSMRGGFRGFVKRRARRILPPYYAALALCILLFPIFNAGGFPPKGLLLSHMLLVHNVTPRWLYGISAPFWSVAVEWHIYFIFAAVLLPAWRRLGGAMTLLIALLIGIGPLYLLPQGWNLEWSCPWYVALFALGMIAAAMSNGSRFGTVERWWGTLSVAAGLLTLGLFLFHKTGWVRDYGWQYLRIEHRGGSWLLDIFVGVTVSFALLNLTRSIQTGCGGASARLVSALQCKPVSTLGAFSYSLYLIHAPILGLIALGIARLNPGPFIGYVSIYLAGVPLGLLAAYIFYLGVERYCVSSKQRQRVAEPIGVAVRAELPTEIVPSL